MRRFLRELVVFLAIQVAVGAFILAHVRRDENHYLASARDKHARLESTAAPRIIFVGGSSMAMGLDSAAIDRRFPQYQPVNMGLHLTLGLEFMLAEIEESLRPGDVVVLSPEYNLFLADQGNYILLQVVELRPESLVHVKWSKALDLGLNYFGRLVRKGVKGIQGRGDLSNDPPYVRSGFNEYGDMTLHWNMPHPELTRVALTFSDTTPPYMRKMIRRLNDFDRLCHRRGAAAVFIYPPFADAHFHRQRDAVEKIQAALDESLTIPILNRPEDSVQPIDRFFDTSYHLFRDGIRVRTNQIADLLQQHLAKDQG